jgi:pyruvate/2-oxoacid:ferredoxin oxidoreductase beta subunit
MAEHQAKLAADSRTFPVFIYNPAKGKRLKERLSLRGNPNMKDDWYVHPKTKEQIDFLTFARSEGRFSKHFDRDGNASPTMLAAREDRLENWNLLQEMAGVT